MTGSDKRLSAEWQTVKRQILALAAKKPCLQNLVATAEDDLDEGNLGCTTVIPSFHIYYLPYRCRDYYYYYYYYYFLIPSVTMFLRDLVQKISLSEVSWNDHSSGQCRNESCKRMIAIVLLRLDLHFVHPWIWNSFTCFIFSELVLLFQTRRAKWHFDAWSAYCQCLRWEGRRSQSCLGRLLWTSSMLSLRLLASELKCWFWGIHSF